MTTLKELIRKCWNYQDRLFELSKNGIVYRMSFEGGCFVVSMDGQNGYIARFISGDVRNQAMDIDVETCFERVQKQVLKSIQIRYSTVKYSVR